MIWNGQWVIQMGYESDQTRFWSKFVAEELFSKYRVALEVVYRSVSFPIWALGNQADLWGCVTSFK